MSTVRAWACHGFTLHKWASILFSNDFQPTLAEQSCVYSTTFGPCVIHNCSFTHTFTWLSSVCIAVEITTLVARKCFHHSCAFSCTMMLPTLTATETRWKNFLAVFRLGYSLAKRVTELYSANTHVAFTLSSKYPVIRYSAIPLFRVLQRPVQPWVHSIKCILVYGEVSTLHGYCTPWWCLWS